MKTKIKVLIFHQWLAPYRIDQFNYLNELFDLDVTYLFSNLAYDKFDQDILLSKCNFRIKYMLNGLQHKSRVFRFGILKRIRETKPDIILSYEYSFTTQYLVLLKSMGFINQKLGSLVDDSLDICHNPRSSMRAIARDKSIKYLDYLVVLSHEVANYYKSAFSLREDQTIVSPILQLPERIRNNATSLESIARDYQSKYDLYGKKVLLYVGRLSSEKALPTYLDNIHNILLEDDNVRFVIVGEGSEYEAINSIVINRGLQDKVIFAGRYEGDSLNAWYLCASGLVLPSISETFGAVVNESLIFGKRVLCSQLAGASTLISNDNGTIFDPLDQQDTIYKTQYFISSIDPITEIALSTSQSIMTSHPDDYVSEWNKVSIV